MHKVLGLIPSPHHINQPWWNMAEIPILVRLEAGESGVQGHPHQHSRFEASLSYVRLSHNESRLIRGLQVG